MGLIHRFDYISLITGKRGFVEMPSLWKVWKSLIRINQLLKNWEEPFYQRENLRLSHTSHNDLEKPMVFPHSHKDDGYFYIWFIKDKKSGVGFQFANDIWKNFLDTKNCLCYKYFTKEDLR
jgi:hypothetical protein